MARTHSLSRAALLLCAVAICLSSALAASSEDQKQALLLLRGAIDRDGALATSWDPATSECTWSGIKCDAKGNVVDINLANKGLKGQLPLDENLWSSLGSVKNLDLSSNQLDGYLPPQMSGDKSLEYLSLRDNNLKSPLPTSWSGLSNLKGLDLGQNQLYGDLPASYGNIPGLQAIDLSGNQFSGTIPSDWSSIPGV